MSIKPNFDETLKLLVDAIENRKIDVYKDFISKNDILYTIVQNGHAFTTSRQLIDMHEIWFKDEGWIWTGSVIHKIEGENLAFALIKYDYRAKKEDPPFSSWLTYVFQIENNKWRIVHDHNTALDFLAFSKSMNENS